MIKRLFYITTEKGLIKAETLYISNPSEFNVIDEYMLRTYYSQLLKLIIMFK